MSVYLQPSLQLFRFPPLPNSITESSCSKSCIFKKHSDVEFPSVTLTHVTGSLSVLWESRRFSTGRLGLGVFQIAIGDIINPSIRKITRIPVIASLSDSKRLVCVFKHLVSVFPRNNDPGDRT